MKNLLADLQAKKKLNHHYATNRNPKSPKSP